MPNREFRVWTSTIYKAQLFKEVELRLPANIDSDYAEVSISTIAPLKYAANALPLGLNVR